MIQNFKPYTKATLVEPMKVQIEKKNDQGETIKGPDGKADHGRADRYRAEHRSRSDGVAGRNQDARDQRRWIRQRQRRSIHSRIPRRSQILSRCLSIFAIGSGLTYYLGRMVKNQKHGWTVWAAMVTLFLGGVLLCWWAESSGNPIHQHLGVAAADGNMEGKEVRFGIFNSALFATVTTDASCGAVNSMHDSFTALGGFVPLFNIQLGEIIIGGVGAGLYGMLVFVVLAVFIAGLMVGRTPEYLGKKIEAYDVKMAMLSLLILAISILGFAAWAVVSKWGLAGLNNNGPHGLSEILYAFSSGAGNNGSAFAGLSGNTPWYNTTLGLDMLFGRFLMIVPIMALAGSLVQKKVAPASAGTFPVHGGTFLILLLGTVLLVGALNFLPALTLGPIVEHFLMQGGKLF